MKIKIHWFVLILCIVGLGGCDPNRPESGGVQRVLLPWAQEADGTYSLQVVSLTSLKNPRELRGPAAQIYIDSYLAEGGFGGRVARPQLLRDKSGIWYPSSRDDGWLGVAAYAHFERFWQMDRRLGVAHHLRWPRSVGVEMRVTETDRARSEGRREVEAFDSARYYLLSDVVVISRRQSENLPMGLNGGVLAHEHFHAYFTKILLKPALLALGNWPSRMGTAAPHGDAARFFWRTGFSDIENHNVGVLLGWNEGLADFWGWVYSGDPEFVAESLPRRRLTRSLGGPLLLVHTPASWMAKMHDGSDRLAEAYRLGTQIARALRFAAAAGGEPVDREARERWGREAVLGLERAAPAVLSRLRTQALDPALILQFIVSGTDLENPRACQILRQATGGRSVCSGGSR